MSYFESDSSADMESLQLGLVLAVVILLNTLLDFTQRQNAEKVLLYSCVARYQDNFQQQQQQLQQQQIM